MKNALKLSLLGLALVVGMSVSAQQKKAVKKDGPKRAMKTPVLSKKSTKKAENKKEEKATAKKSTSNKKGMAVNEQGSSKSASAKKQ